LRDRSFFLTREAAMDWLLNTWAAGDMPVAANKMLFAMFCGLGAMVLARWLIVGLAVKAIGWSGRAAMSVVSAGAAMVFAGYFGAAVLGLSGLGMIGWGLGHAPATGTESLSTATATVATPLIPWQTFNGVGLGLMVLGIIGIVRSIVADANHYEATH
jgi:hypothetical protein